MSGLELAGVFLVGLVAGVVNTLAGGGSLLTLPILVEMGMASTAANATNRVAVLMQSATSVARFGARNLLPRASLALLPASVLGALLGATAAARIDDASFDIALAVVFAGMGVVLVRRLLRGDGDAPAHDAELPRGPLAHVALFGVGFYGGFVQAGVGVLLIWVLHVVGRLEIVRSNAVKVLLVLAWTLVSLAVFAAGGLVDWRSGAVLGAGGAVGAWLGVGVATRVDPRVLVFALAVGVWVAAARFAGLLG